MSSKGRVGLAVRARAILAQQAEISRIAAHARLRKEHVLGVEVLKGPLRGSKCLSKRLGTWHLRAVRDLGASDFKAFEGSEARSKPRSKSMAAP